MGSVCKGPVFFLIHSQTLYLLNGALSPFTFKVIVDRYVRIVIIIVFTLALQMVGLLLLYMFAFTSEIFFSFICFLIPSFGLFFST